MEIKLRALEPCDIDAIFRWENDPAVWAWSAAHQPFSRHALEQFIEESSLTDIYSSRQLRLVSESEGKAVGCIDLFDFDPHNRKAGVGIIVDGEVRRQGVGRAMLEALEGFAGEHLLMHQLHCTVAADNGASLGLFRKCGYRECGRLEEWVFQRGEWVDAIVFQKVIG